MALGGRAQVFSTTSNRHSGAPVPLAWYEHPVLEPRESFWRSSWPTDMPARRTLLHFGWVDWHSCVCLNGNVLGGHTGGHDGYRFDSMGQPARRDAELRVYVYVYDKSGQEHQPNGKQRASAIDGPGGDKCMPSNRI